MSEENIKLLYKYKIREQKFLGKVVEASSWEKGYSIDVDWNPGTKGLLKSIRLTLPRMIILPTYSLVEWYIHIDCFFQYVLHLNIYLWIFKPPPL